MGAGNQGAFAGADGKIMDKIRRVIGGHWVSQSS
jgi:hypothetical protein